MESNRKLGKQAVYNLLAELPPAVSVENKVDKDDPSFSVDLDGGVRLEVSNYPNWALTLDCQNVAKRVQVFRRRLQEGR